jgi:hypothetical protein
MNIHTIFNPIAMEYIFFSASHRTFSKIGHILGHGGNLKK